MPEICRFLGIIIRMFYEDHNPPHFHVFYGADKATFDIRTLGLLDGNLPKRVHSLVIEWALSHREELMTNWELCNTHEMPNKIEPLC